MAGMTDKIGSEAGRSSNVTRVQNRVSVDARWRRNGHKGGVLWFTGLSAAGKSTLAVEVEARLFAQGYHVYLLDGDNVRHGLCSNLGFSAEDRLENIRRAGEVAALFAEAGFIIIAAFISPYRTDRRRAREAAEGRFHEVYVEADLAVCERRDPKGLYKRARAGEIKDFTGVSAPYEPPERAEIVVNTVRHDVEACSARIVQYVEDHFPLEAVEAPGEEALPEPLAALATAGD
jgi:bifunctional enzyme CysN/CysC